MKTEEALAKLDEQGVSKEHPIRDALVLQRSFASGSLKHSPVKRALEPIVISHVNLYFGKLPWSVRFFALVTGRLPFSYPEN